MLKIHIFFSLFLLPLTNLGYCTTLNPVPIEAGVHTTAFASTGTIVNGRLVFLQRQTQIGADIPTGTIWSTDGSLSGTVELNPQLSNSTFNTSMVRLNDQVFFQATTSIDDRFALSLWVTNGLPEGTRQISNDTLPNLSLQVSGDTLYGFALDSSLQPTLITSDGNDFEIIDSPFELLNDPTSLLNDPLISLCSISRNDFIFVSTVNRESRLFRYTNGQITSIGMQGNQLLPRPVFRNVGSEVHCYYSVTNQEAEENILRVSEQSSPQVIIVPGDNLTHEISITPFSDSLLVNRGLNTRFITTDIYAISGDLTNLDTPVIPLVQGGSLVPFGTNRIIGLSTSANNVHVFYLGTPSLLEVAYDQSFNPTFPLQIANGATFDQTAHTIGNIDLIFSPSAQLLRTFQNDQIISGPQFNDLDIFQIIEDTQDPNSGQVYAIATNLNNITPQGASNLFKFETAPTIQNDLSGIWAVNDVPNQGMTVHTGITPTGREFIFVAIFTHNNGQPYWLSGNIDFLPGNQQVQFSLRQFSSQDFFNAETANADTQATPVGNLILTRTSCNTLQAEFEFTNGVSNQQLEFRRLEDAQFSARCLQQ